MYSKYMSMRFKKCILSEFDGSWEKAAKHFNVNVKFIANIALDYAYPTPKMLTWIDNIEEKKALDVSMNQDFSIRIFGQESIVLMRDLLDKDELISERPVFDYFEKDKLRFIDFNFKNLPYKNRLRMLYNLRAMSLKELIAGVAEQAGRLGQSSMCIDIGADCHRKSMLTYGGEIERRFEILQLENTGGG